MVDVKWLINFSIKSIWKRRTRSILTMAGIGVGVALLLALVSLVYGMSVESTAMIRRLTSADISIRNVTVALQNEGLPGPSRGFLHTSYIDESVIDALMKMNGVYVVTPVLTTQAELNGSRVILQGIDPSTYVEVTGG